MFGEIDGALRGPLEASPRPGVPAAGSIPSRKRKGTLLTDQRVFNQSSKETLYREFQVFLRDHWSENQFVTPLHI